MSKNWTWKYELYKDYQHLRKSDVCNVRSIKLKFSVDVVVSRSCFELILWMSKLKTIDREAVSWKLLFKIQKIYLLQQFA